MLYHLEQLGTMLTIASF
jgi:Kyakuja-Dileera-Zisupton transposase